MPVDLVGIPHLKIDGRAVSEEISRSLIAFEVDDSLLLPGMASVRLLDQDFKWADADTFALGKAIEVKIVEQSGETSLMVGEITAVEPDFGDSDNPVTVIRGYDKSHRLYRGKKTRNFINMTDSDIASKIAGDYGLSATVDSTSGTYDLVCQDNQSDIEFLRERAQRIGYFLYVAGGALYFVKTPRDNTVVEVEWGRNLSEFHARLTAAEQVNKVIVRDWDPKQKREIVGQKTTPSGAPQPGGKYGGQAAQSAFGSSEEVVIDGIAGTQQEAANLAQSICDDIGHAFLQAEGSCVGMPTLQAGVLVNIKGIGRRFSRQYRVTRAVHTMHSDGTYRTRFEVSGRRPSTLARLLADKSDTGHGMVVGVVTNLDDPGQQGRVKVKYPTRLDSATGTEIESTWARLVAPGAGAHRGLQFYPEVDDEVLLAFEHDDIHRPYILGGLWNGQDPSPLPASQAIQNGGVQKRVIKSRSGHTITLDDTDNQEKVSIVDKTGKNSLEMDASSGKMAITIKADKTITLQTAGGHKVLIDESGPGKVEVISGGNSVKIDSGQNSINIESASQLKLKAQTIQIEGTSVTIKGQAATNIEGANTTVKGSALLTIQGGLVKIN